MVFVLSTMCMFLPILFLTRNVRWSSVGFSWILCPAQMCKFLAILFLTRTCNEAQYWWNFLWQARRCWCWWLCSWILTGWGCVWCTWLSPCTPSMYLQYPFIVIAFTPRRVRTLWDGEQMLPVLVTVSGNYLNTSERRRLDQALH